MKAITSLIVLLLISAVFLGVCNGAVWFEGGNPQEPQETRLTWQSIRKTVDYIPNSPPTCYLILNGTKPHNANLTVNVSTAALFYQNENFETWLSIDSQTPEKLVGVFDSSASALGAFYNRQYNVNLNWLEAGAHLLKIRVTGEYYGPEGGNYDCTGNVTIVIDNQPEVSPTITEIWPTANTELSPTNPFPTATIIAVAALIGCAIIITAFLKAKRNDKKNHN
jgi:hypothetical protein